MGFFDSIKQGMEQTKKKIQEYNDLDNSGKDTWKGTCKYLGGHPDAKGEGEGTLKVKSTGILFRKGVQQFCMQIQDIIKVESKTNEQISKDVTLTRLIALGIFAFGLKKKRIDKHTYLVITYSDCGIENTILFETDHAQTISGAIIKAKQQQEINNPKVSVNIQENTFDIPEQIKKLADLKEQGILTEDEFQKKKDELLSRI
jgi:hypothetical protein